MADNNQSNASFEHIPQSTTNNTNSSYALSGKIMLSAIVILFAVVVIMVCLHIYARWYILRNRRRQLRRNRRRTRLVFYVEPNDPSSIIPIPSRGLDPSILKSLPTFSYHKKHQDQEHNNDIDSCSPLECAVCLSEFEENEKGRLLPKCKHSFHVDCIDMWFHSQSTCPICRAPVDAGDLTHHDKGDDVLVELGDLGTSQTGAIHERNTELTGPSRVESSVGARRKGLDLVGGVSIEIPNRSQSFSFTTEESSSSRSPRQGFKSPTSRILSLRRILSREKKSPLPSPSGVGPSSGGGGGNELGGESDVELGQVETPSQCLTPR